MSDLKLDQNKYYEPIAEGLDRAIWRMITSATMAPGADFYATIGDAVRAAFDAVPASPKRTGRAP